MLLLALAVALAAEPETAPSESAPAETTPAEPAPADPPPADPNAPAQPVPTDPNAPADPTAPEQPAAPFIPAEELNNATEAPPPPIDTREAQELKALKPGELKKFEPKRFLLPQNPRGQTDFTAYTLEWGEFEVGTSLTAGILPSTELGTILLLDAFQIFNVEGKIDFLRIGPWDLAANVNFYTMNRPEVNGQFFSAGGTTSFILLPPWSLHLGGWYSTFNAHGEVPSDFVGGLLSTFTGSPIDTSSAPDLGLDLTAKAGTAMIATDVRFNRRDSLILQARALLWRDLAFNAGLTTVDDPIITREDSGWTDITQNYVASLSYQLSTRHWDLRLGVGWPIVNPAWVTQAIELSYRFGGKTRLSERRMDKQFDKNVSDAEKAAKAAKKKP